MLKSEMAESSPEYFDSVDWMNMMEEEMKKREEKLLQKSGIEWTKMRKELEEKAEKLKERKS